MSLLEREWNPVECEQEGPNLRLPSHFAEYRCKRNSQSWDECSSYDGDRPNSRLTVLESPCDSHLDHEDDLCLDLDSPQLTGEAWSGCGGAPAFCCEECLECFSSPAKLKQHEYSHTGETPFQCNVTGCVKKFTSKFKLKRHILIHSQTKTFTCHVCNRAFRRKDHLKNHEKVHNPGKTVYSCHYGSCDRTYNTVSSFKKHQAMHSAQEGQLDCKICKAILVSQDDLLNHLKTHTGSRGAKGTSDKKFGCNQCDKKFFTRKDLKRHSVVHTGNREFSCPYCSQRFGRKDHMTRHAKKTHQQFFEPGRQRLPSTPTPLRVEAAKNSRKERSISDPGPFPSSPNYSPDHGEVRPVLSSSQATTAAAAGFHKVEIPDPDDRAPDSFVLVRPEFGADNPPPGSQHSQIYTIPEKILSSVDLVQKSPSSDDFDLKHQVEPLIARYANLDPIGGSVAEESKKLESFAYSNSTENAIKELLEEKDNIDFDSFISEMGEDMFEKRGLPLVDSSAFCQIKQEPQSRPDTPVPLSAMTKYSDDDNPEESFPGPALLKGKSVVPKPVFMRTQSQDSLTRTKNPVLPSIHAEGTLVVPEPKQNRYSSQDPFTLEFAGGDSQLAELKGSLFMTDEDSSGYFQPWH